MIPDEDWPDQYSKSDIAFSGDDVKTHSGWREKKGEEFSKDHELITRGSLVAVEVYDPGSSITMPGINDPLHLGVKKFTDERKSIIKSEQQNLYIQLFWRFQKITRFLNNQIIFI